MATASAHSMHDLVSALRARRSLAPDEIAHAAEYLLAEGADANLKSDFLQALTQKGETDAEIAGFVEAFLDRAVDPGLDPSALPGPAIDVCGTGGDRLDLFNVSTTVMFVLAAGGAAVVKHGNRSVTSQCGGADVLEELGVRIDLSPEAFREQLQTVGCGFLFAPHYHPAFKTIAPVRKALGAQGIATIFNLLGPLLNPARPAHQLVGVFSEAALPKYAATLRRLGRFRAWAVHGRAGNDRGMDEISTMGTTAVHGVDSTGTLEPSAITPEMLQGMGMGRPGLGELRGGSRSENARIVAGILDGTVTGPKRELVEINAAAAFVVAGLAAGLPGGVALAREQLDSGRAFEKLKAMRARE